MVLELKNVVFRVTFHESMRFFESFFAIWMKKNSFTRLDPVLPTEFSRAFQNVVNTGMHDWLQSCNTRSNQASVHSHRLDSFMPNWVQSSKCTYYRLDPVRPVVHD